MKKNPTKYGRISLWLFELEKKIGQNWQPKCRHKDLKKYSEFLWYSTQSPLKALMLEHLCEFGHFPPGLSLYFFECKHELQKFEYFGLRLVFTLGLHFISVKFDLSHFLEKEKTYQHQGTVNGKCCAFCTQISVPNITVGCKCSTLMVWNKL